jgi:hypothetical protein
VTPSSSGTKSVRAHKQTCSVVEVAFLDPFERGTIKTIASRSRRAVRNAMVDYRKVISWRPLSWLFQSSGTLAKLEEAARLVVAACTCCTRYLFYCKVPCHRTPPPRSLCRSPLARPPFAPCRQPHSRVPVARLQLLVAGLISVLENSGTCRSWHIGLGLD